MMGPCPELARRPATRASHHRVAPDGRRPPPVRRSWPRRVSFSAGTAGRKLPDARRRADPGRPGRPPAASRAQILAAARELIGRDGWEKLTVRRLAAELGVGTTTL